ncbi:hypothetical protein FGO68_gene4308 [Halteria grandinella]|uniref:Uncharacterized protein n=1 Tax=Halteria grandinella TaxID=5974 RepID=A0A8J8NZQ7_HALGN|nr:hypothetical protein FGO68_gene4308 [Halteria grandinella]
MIYIKIDKQIEDVEVFFETLFNGSLKLFKYKSIDQNDHIKPFFNGNVCVRNGDTHTQSLWTNSCDLAVLALNNCTILTRLEIQYAKNCEYQQLKVEKLPLQELIIDDSSLPLIQDILNKSKDTLSSLECYADVDLSPLRNSTQLRTLRIHERLLLFIGRMDINNANLEVIRTFNNLQELKTKDQKVLLQFSKSQTLKTLRWDNTLSKIDDLPQSVTKVSAFGITTFDEANQFLEKNPFVKELEISVQAHVATQLLDKFKHVKFNFDFRDNVFTFKQCYTYLHPECKKIGIPGSEPDHVLYELLFSRLDDKQKVLEPYLQAVFVIRRKIQDAPPQMMMEQLQTFNEFKNCLRQDNLDSSYFERVFNQQMSIDDDEYLLIIVSAYDEVFQLQADIHKTVKMLKAMGQEKRTTLKRERFFYHSRHNWMQPLRDEDFRTN